MAEQQQKQDKTTTLVSSASSPLPPCDGDHLCVYGSFVQMLQDPCSFKLLAMLDDGPSLDHDSCITQVCAADANRPDQLKVVEEKSRKRKRRRGTRKGGGPSESQRMNHITVERNRRRLMNEHLAALRSLMPNSYSLRGDQASIVGGAIDYVKDLEQQLQTLEAEKETRAAAADGRRPFDRFFVSPQYTVENCDGGGEGAAAVEATVVQTHVSVRVLVPRRPGRLLRAIAVLERLRLAVLHLNVASFHDSALYSFNLKIEEECKLTSADEIATAVHQIFAYVS